MSQTSCRCSTPQRNWSQREGSNLRPNPYEGPDLPLIYSAGIGADGRGRTRISTMARSNSQPLNHARELVETLGLEPRFSGCRPEVLPLNDVPKMQKTNDRCGPRLRLSSPGFHGHARSSMATKNPSRSGPEGFADLSIVARIFYPGGTPPHRLGCPILTSMTCPHDAPPNHRCRYSGRVKARPDVSRDFMS